MAEDVVLAFLETLDGFVSRHLPHCDVLLAISGSGLWRAWLRKEDQVCMDRGLI
jgi:hypothetical protein